MGYKEDLERQGVHEPGLRLYNLQRDLGEQTNVAAEYPEVVQKLKRLADKQAATLCDGPARAGVVDTTAGRTLVTGYFTGRELKNMLEFWLVDIRHAYRSDSAP